MVMPRLLVEDVAFSRGGSEILRGVKLAHEGGGVLSILGPSGSGKTTLLWLMAGLLSPTRGQVRFEPADAPPRLGVVFQDGALWDHLRVRTHLELVLRGRGLSAGERRARVGRILDETKLTSLAWRRPGQLSGGERQRLALARALVVEPQWLLLDEPTSQLDGPAREALLELLEERLRRSPAGVVLATHQVDLALRLSDRVAVLIDGRIAQVAPPAELYAHPADLQVARLLGPAFELCGRAYEGQLIIGDRVVLQGLAAELTGDQRLILRPEQVLFEADEAGMCVVRACSFAATHWQVHLSADGGEAMLAASAEPLPIGVRGRISLRRR